MSKKPELLAPAGNLKKLKYAFTYGADAVYCGLPDFSLRAKTDFDMKSIKEGIVYAKDNKKKIYITINIFAHNSHIKKLPKFLAQLKKNPPHAIIASDPGVIQIVKKVLPKTPIHLSTQANTLNYEAVKFWKKLGIKRIILGREVSLKDISEMKKLVKNVELETFVHGAMCMSYSGRCYLSAWINDRSANEGLCTQPCRWNYNVYLEEPKRPGMMIPVKQAGEQGSYILNSRDLCLIDHLDSLSKAGVMSFKLEGRTKSIYYLSVVVKAYRQAIDLMTSIKSATQKNKGLAEIKKELQKVDNREYEKGFLFCNDSKKLMNFKSSKPKNDWEFKGEILKIADDEVFIRIHNILKNNSQIEIVTPTDVYKIRVKQLKEKGVLIKEARGGAEKTFSFKLDNIGKYNIGQNCLLRKKKGR